MSAGAERVAATGTPGAPGTARGDAGAVIVLAALVAFAGLLRLPGLSSPSQMFFDEIYYAKAARQILAGVEVTEERTHPPLSKLIIAAGVRLAGDGAVGWRIAGAVAGVLLVATVYALALLVFRDRFIAGLSGLLLAADGLAVVESRIAKPDIFLTLFLFAAYTASWLYVRRRHAGWLYAAGAAAGLAIATKWTAAVPLATIPAMLLALRVLGRVALGRRDVVHLGAAFLAVPAAVYLLTYIPYFRLGHGLGDLWALQMSMYEFHAGLKESHPYTSAWWSWPLLLRPIWYEYREVGGGIHQGILAIGNPVVWWAGLPAMVFVAARAVRMRGTPEILLVVGFTLSYLQYAVISRVLFLYHFLPALPFLIMALAVALAHVRARIGPVPVLLFVLFAVGWLVVFYPVLAGVPVPTDRIMRLMWFGSWI